MASYQEVIDALRALRTVASHITSLGKLMNETEDQKLKSLLGTVITALQQAHANPAVKGKTTPGSLYNSTVVGIKVLITYCESFIATKKPEWKVLAERHDWTPKT
jgi:hypothetical protein